MPVLGEVLGNSIYQKNHHGNHPHSSLDLLDSEKLTLPD
jgi:hypothetical protein